MITALALAAATSLACPGALAVHRDRSFEAPGWTVGFLPGHRRPRPGSHALSGVSLSDGPPAEQAFLAPDDSDRAGGALTNRWSLGRSPRGYWLICEYESSGANLSRRLPPEIGQCSVRYDASDRVLKDGRAVACGPAETKK